jgi:hypothetical protein
MTEATIGPIPVFMRVGDSQEYEVGTLEPEVTYSEDVDGIARSDVSAPLNLAKFLRALADAVEGERDNAAAADTG